MAHIYQAACSQNNSLSLLWCLELNIWPGGPHLGQVQSKTPVKYPGYDRRWRGEGGRSRNEGIDCIRIIHYTRENTTKLKWMQITTCRLKNPSSLQISVLPSPSGKRGRLDSWISAINHCSYTSSFSWVGVSCPSCDRFIAVKTIH